MASAIPLLAYLESWRKLKISQLLTMPVATLPAAREERSRINNLLKFDKVYWILNWIAWINIRSEFYALDTRKVIPGWNLNCNILPVSGRSAFANDIENDNNSEAELRDVTQQSYPAWKDWPLNLFIQLFGSTGANRKWRWSSFISELLIELKPVSVWVSKYWQIIK